MKKNHIRHLLSVPCKGTSVDYETNLLTIFEMLEELTVDAVIKNDSEIINLPIQFQVLTIWERDPSEVDTITDAQIEIVDPNKKKLGTFNYQVVFPSNKKRFRNRININGMSLTVSGIYTFKISKREKDLKNFEQVNEFTINIVINKQIGQVK